MSGLFARASSAKPGRIRVCSSSHGTAFSSGADRRELLLDDLVQRQGLAELRLDPVVDLRIAELLQQQVERVPLGDRAVPVEDEEGC